MDAALPTGGLEQKKIEQDEHQFQQLDEDYTVVRVIWKGVEAPRVMKDSATHDQNVYYIINNRYGCFWRCVLQFN